MKVTVSIDPNTCISAANCTGIAPQFFRIADQAYVEMLDRQGQVQGIEWTYDASTHELELLHEAVDSCPTRAITVVEAGD